MKRIIITCVIAFLLFSPQLASAQIFNPKKILEKKGTVLISKNFLNFIIDEGELQLIDYTEVHLVQVDL